MVELKQGTGNQRFNPTPAFILFFSISVGVRRAEMFSRKTPLPPLERFFVFQTTPPTKKSTPPQLPRTGKHRGEQKANLTEVEREPHWGRGGGKPAENPEKDTTTRRGRGQPQQPNKNKHQKKKRKKNNQQKIISKIIFQTKIFLWYN